MVLNEEKPHLPYLLLQASHLGSGVFNAREHIRQKGEEERNVLGHQLGNHCLTHALDQDLEGVTELMARL